MDSTKSELNRVQMDINQSGESFGLDNFWLKLNLVFFVFFTK